MVSNKGSSWSQFSEQVLNHIEEYVVPQYGDEGEDECATYSVEDCIKQIKKYAARNGRNSRVGQDLVDLLKIAHYAQIAAKMIQEQENAKK
jgi:hypothetical protein